MFSGLTNIRLLVLPTTFDKDPQLRFTSGVITIVVVAFLTGGYSLTALLWFACPSLLFRLESIFIPAASISAFGFLACVWALVTSSRFDPTQPSCPVAIILSIVSFTVYGALGFWTSRRITKITSPPPVQQSVWTDSASYYSAYAPSTQPLTTRSDSYVSYQSPPAAAATAATATTVEEDAVGQQMASLLSKTNPQPSPDATQETFRLEWPPGGEDDEEGTRRNRTRTMSAGAAFLSPGDARRHGRNNSDTNKGAMARIGRAIGLGDRGRVANRNQKERDERARSREERRQQIELGDMP